MRFGVAKELITPPFRMKLACTGREDDDFENIHDDIYVRCLIFEDDASNAAVLMSFDLLFHERSLNDTLAEYAEEAYGIDKARVCISYTHAHTAPAVRGYNPGHEDEAYESILIDRGKRCLDKALCAMFEGYMEYGSVDIDLNLSRRHCVNGVYINAPDFEYAHDRELFVLCVRDTSGQVRSILVNYACHPVFYPARLTLCGEFPARLCQLLDGEYYGAATLFFQSAGGDVRPAAAATTRSDGSPKWARMDFTAIDRFSQALAGHVKTLLSKGTMQKITLRISAEAFSVELPIDGVPREVFEQKWEKYKDMQGNADKTNAYRILHGGYELLPDSMTLHCQLLRLGDKLCVAAMGGEPCFGIKRAVADVLQGYDVCFVGYTDACAYIVDDTVLAEGGYEAQCHLEYGLKGPFRPGITKRIMDGFEQAWSRLTANNERGGFA